MKGREVLIALWPISGRQSILKQVTQECELCVLARLTEWLYEDELVVVVLCESCGVPMVVLREHEIELGEESRQRVLGTLTEVAGTYYGKMEFYVDEHMRQIPDHLHFHARPKAVPWWQYRNAGDLS